VSWLKDRSANRRFFIVLKLEGMDPEKELFSSSRATSDVMLAMAEGRDPEN